MATAFDPAVHGAMPGEDAVADAETAKKIHDEKMQAACSGVIARLEEEVTDRLRRRQPVELRWLEDLRQYHGIYGPEIMAIFKDDPDRSKIFINYTRPKTTAWSARLGDMLFPNDDRNWGLKATTVPELSDQAKKAVRDADEADAQAQAAVQQHNQMVEQGASAEDIAPVRQELETKAKAATDARAYAKSLRAERAEADRRAELMQATIDDQLSESKYPAVSRDVIDDSCKLGIGVLKGPLTATSGRMRWEKVDLLEATSLTPPSQNTPADMFQLVKDTNPKPFYRRVNPWHFFPDPDALDLEDSEGTFERHLLSRSKMRRWAKRLGWSPDAVARLLKDSPQPTTGGEFWNLTQLRLMDGKSTEGFVNRYVVWEFHGALECDEICSMLRALGKNEEADAFEQDADPLDEHMVILYFCQGQLLKIEEYFPLDSGETLYSLFPFEKDEATIFGAVGVPRLMAHAQAMLNSGVRMMQDNAGLSVGPQIVIDKTQVEPENGKWKLTPRKVWKKKGQDIGKDQAPFATYNIPSNQAQLQGIIELALRFIDEVISMPMIAQGEQGTHITQTSSGMSMLFNSANVVFRRVVKNWDDDLTTPTIRRAFDWNMQFNDNDAIKGDMQAEARGTSVLLVKELQSQQLMLVAQNWSAHPVIGPAIEVYHVLRLTLQALSINPDDVLCDKDEFQRRVKAAAEAAQGQESPDQVRAQATLEAAKIGADSHRQQSETQREIALINQKTEILKLMQKDGANTAMLEAMLAGKKMDTDSKERMFAAEAAIERQNAAEARANGEQPTGSGGYISQGDTDQ